MKEIVVTTKKKNRQRKIWKIKEGKILLKHILIYYTYIHIHKKIINKGREMFP